MVEFFAPRNARGSAGVAGHVSSAVRGAAGCCGVARQPPQYRLDDEYRQMNRKRRLKGRRFCLELRRRFVIVFHTYPSRLRGAQLRIWKTISTSKGPKPTI